MEIRGGKRFRSRAERREIVLETLKPGRSVAQIALEHGINANQIFQWRRQYKENLLDEEQPSTALIPVTISEAIQKQSRGRVESRRATAGAIHIEVGRARVRIEGAADVECIRAVIKELLG